MTVSIVITGYKKWDEYTLPFLQSIQQYTTGFQVVCVDLDSQYPDFPGVQMVRHPLTSYAAALNLGIQAHKADWYFLNNNDLLITKPFDASQVEALDPDCIYSWVMVDKKTVGFEYLESFSMFLSQKVIDKIGLFDENFKPMWFEGSDLCYRAQQAGFKLAPPLDRLEWGVYHREDERDGERKQYMAEHIEQRRANRAYLQQKHGIVK
jgi:GT2 family glycosyltransferase